MTPPEASITAPEMLAVPDDACPKTVGLIDNRRISVKLRLMEAQRSLLKPELTWCDRIMFD
jgi:hypothetical protein